MKIKKNTFKKSWIAEEFWIFKLKYPNINEDELLEFLDSEFDNNVRNDELTFHNNYKKIQNKITPLDLFDWIENAKPIIGGHGVFYMNQHQSPNPSAMMLENFLSTRKKFKDKLHFLEEGGYEYLRADRLQLSEKVGANSCYGAGGNPYSFFYNIYTATSITSTGQSLISTTGMAFEQFLSNSVWFVDLDNMMDYIYKVCNEKYSDRENILPPVNRTLLVEEFKFMFGEFYDDDYQNTIDTVVANLNDKMVARLYYKNNIYGFTLIPSVRKLLISIFEKVESFKNPYNIPEVIKDELNLLWELYAEFVMYNHFTMERIDRLRFHKRKSVVVVDTDS